jgi:hypothetical protein
MFVFGLFWTLLAVLPLLAVLGVLGWAVSAGYGIESGSVLVVLLASVFPTIGIIGLFFAPAWDARRRARTDYLVTTERVIIISGLSGRWVRWLPLSELQADVKKPATVAFTPLTPFGGWYRGQQGVISDHPAGLAFVLPDKAEAESICKLIRDLKAPGTGPSPASPPPA